MNSQRKYSPGDIVNGFVLLSLRENDKRRGIWHIQCHCGETFLARPYDLKVKKGCINCKPVRIAEQMLLYQVGDIVEGLEILELGSRSKPYTIKCHCGNIIKRRGSNITAHANCMKCLVNKPRPEVRKPNDLARKNTIYRKYKDSAKSRNLSFELTLDQTIILCKKSCYYCGSEPTSYAGIDRVDNSIGYVEGNIVPCCAKCNRSKFTYTVEDFKNWVKRAYDHLFNDYPEREYTQASGNIEDLDNLDHDIV